MNDNYKKFIEYLQANEIKFENNEAAKLVRFGYNIDMGTIEIVVDFENDKRIGFFSFLNINVTEARKAEALELINSFNESLNYGCIIVSQSNQLVYKIMYTTFDNLLKDEQWAEIIFRLWSISRDIYPLFGRLIFTNEGAVPLFNEFLRSKEKLQGIDHHLAPTEGEDKKTPGNVTIWKDFRDWYMQN
ncbi:MAG: hypothetical protein ACRCSQ_06135 [Bacteroidales bacterium]